MRTSIKASGFTLIELIMFLLIVGVALTTITLLFVQNVRHSSDPLIRQKMITVAQAYLDEIVRKRWDELTPEGGGCIDTASTVCESLWQGNTRYEVGERVRPTTFNSHLYEVIATAASSKSDPVTEPTWPTGGGTVIDGDITWQDLGIPSLGADGGELRWQFDDVDDYHAIADSPPQYPDTADPADGQSPMPGYDGFSISVTVSQPGWEGISASDVKKLDINVTAPNGEALDFVFYRVNY